MPTAVTCTGATLTLRTARDPAERRARAHTSMVACPCLSSVPAMRKGALRLLLMLRDSPVILAAHARDRPRARHGVTPHSHLPAELRELGHSHSLTSGSSPLASTPSAGTSSPAQARVLIASPRRTGGAHARTRRQHHKVAHEDLRLRHSDELAAALHVVRVLGTRLVEPPELSLLSAHT
jgi:hypothetical protein